MFSTRLKISAPSSRTSRACSNLAVYWHSWKQRNRLNGSTLCSASRKAGGDSRISRGRRQAILCWNRLPGESFCLSTGFRISLLSLIPLKNVRRFRPVFFARYAPSARLCTAATAEPEPAYIVLTDSAGFGERLARHLRDHARTVITAVPGIRFRNVNDGVFELDFQNVLDFERLLKSQAPGRDLVLIHLCSVDGAFEPPLSVEQLDAVVSRLLGSALKLVQAIVTGENSSRVKLRFVTWGADNARANNVTGLAQSPLWGFVRAVRAEYPALNCLLVDLPHIDNECVELLSDEILDAGCAEGEIAYDYEHKRSVHRLVSVPAQEYFARSSPKPSQTNRTLTLKCTQPGTLDSLSFQEAAETFARARRGPHPCTSRWPEL